MIIENIKSKKREFITNEDWEKAEKSTRSRFKVISEDDVAKTKTPPMKEVLSYIKESEQDTNNKPKLIKHGRKSTIPSITDEGLQQD